MLSKILTFLCLTTVLIPLTALAQDSDQIRDPVYAELRDFLPVMPARHTSPAEAQRYTLTIGYAELLEEPPGEEFMVKTLPKAVKEKAKLTRIDTMATYRASHSKITLVDRDPEGNPLKKPFALGDILHCVVLGEQEEQVNFTYYYYTCDNVNWITTMEGQPWDYELKKHEHFRNLTLAPGMWYLMAGPSRNYESVVRGEAVVQAMHTYFLIQIKRTN